LGVFPEIETSFKTTDLIESVMAQLERKPQKVDRWRTSDQKDPLVCGGAARGRTPDSAREGLRISALAGTRPRSEDYVVDARCRVSRFPEVIT